MKALSSKLTVTCLVATAVLLMAACGTDEPTPTSSSGGGGSTPTPTEAGFNAEEYFSGETITIIIGWTAGSSSDLQARFLANELPNYIPGNPNIEVTNMPGSGADVACNFLWRAEPDGLTWMGGNGCTHGAMLEGAGQVDYDAREWVHIGTFENRASIWYIRGEAPYDRVQDAVGQSETFTFGTDTPGAQEEFLKQVLDLPMEMIYGLDSGTAENLLQFERGDVDSKIAGGLWYDLPDLRPGWLTDGTLEPFAIIADPTTFIGNNGEIDPPDDLMNVRDLMDEQEVRDWDVLTHTQGILYRKYFMPPETPAEIQEVFIQAFQDAFDDPAFIERLIQMHGREPDEFVVGTRIDEFAQSFDIEEVDEVYDRWDPEYESPL